jgi:hypothetical protein
MEEKKVEQREYWRVMKSNRRALLKEEISVAALAQRKRRDLENQPASVEDSEIMVHSSADSDSHGTSSSDEDFPTDDAKKQAIYRCKKKLPTTGKKWLHVIGGLIRNASPRKRKLAAEEGILCSPEDVAAGRSVGQELDNLKMKRDKTSLKTRRSLMKLLTPSSRKAAGRKWSKLGRPGVLESAWKTRCDALTTDEQAEVTSFYDEYSVVLPGRKSVAKKTKKPKSVLNCTIRRLHQKYTLKRNRRIGLTKFAKLRPSHTILRSKAKFNQCLWEKCTNIGLKLTAVNELCNQARNLGLKIKDEYDCVALTVCDHDGDKHAKLECIQRKCKKCGVWKLRERLQPLSHTKYCHWKVWEKKTIVVDDKSVTRKVLSMKNGTSSVLLG